VAAGRQSGAYYGPVSSTHEHARLRPGVSVIVPVYNGAATVGELVDRLRPVLLDVAPDAHEIVLVNDGSPDDSWTVIERLATEVPSVRGLRLMRNYGQHNALLAGLRDAAYDVAVTLDDDLQHPPEEIPKLLDRLNDGYDVVYGITPELPHSRFRNLMSALTKRALAQAMGVHNIRDISAFRAVRTGLRAASADYESPSVMLDVLLSWGTSRFGTVHVRHDPRREGVSGYTFGKLVNQAMLVLTGFSTKPLRFASFVGFLFTTFGIAVLAYVLIQYWTVGTLPGFPFLASLVAVFGGVQLFALGIFGEYLARVFDRSMDRPPYVVGQSTVPSATDPEEAAGFLPGVEEQVNH
jgi:undecaprenyl-phosphate 4-deoxy-4-formamido-L-arabinose transferase